MENKEYSPEELYVMADRSIKTLRDECIENHNRLVNTLTVDFRNVSKDFGVVDDKMTALQNRVDKLENVVKVGKVVIFVTVFCHIWKKLGDKKKGSSDKNQAENGQK